MLIDLRKYTGLSKYFGKLITGTLDFLVCVSTQKFDWYRISNLIISVLLGS